MGNLTGPALRELLERLTGDLRTAWHPIVHELVCALAQPAGAERWLAPAALVRKAPAEAFEAVARAQPQAVASACDLVRQLDATRVDAWHERVGEPLAQPVAYLCAEFGLAPWLPIYAGGLGVLAGDYLRAAADLGVPLVGVGIFFREGYVRQALDAQGHQRDVFVPVDPIAAGLEPVERDGRPLLVALPSALGAWWARAWRAQVGSCTLYLLDADVEGNPEPLRRASRRLYDADATVRLRMELLLGMGAVKLLASLGVEPSCWHLNEGHAGFAVLERMGRLCGEGLDVDLALETVRANTVFTTHTPIAAGHDRFDARAVRGELQGWCDETSLEWDAVVRVAGDPEAPETTFNMTALCVRGSLRCNGVSLRHAEVSRELLAPYADSLPGAPPIGIVNGVHGDTWMDPAVRALIEGLGTVGALPTDAELWDGALGIDAQRLWHVHLQAKRRLLAAVRARDAARRAREGLPEAPPVLDEDVLTVGFARRFAPYKRAALLLEESDWLERLLTRDPMPVQFVFAGKAHPANEAGKALLARLATWAEERGVAHRFVFVEDYDLELGRAMVQGVDVWLNLPTPPMEASGTSGMKAALNGIPHLSIYDGWWVEGYAGCNGWVVGPTGLERGQRRDVDDAREVLALLEQVVAPTYYDRDARGVPQSWVDVMRCSIRVAGQRFLASRMVRDAAALLYLPCARAPHAGAVSG